MRTLSKEEIQTIRMCIKTYMNMYGVMPTLKAMLEWLGDSYANALALYITNPSAA